MNRHILTRGVAAVALVLTASACDQGLTQVNVNPNAPSTVPAGDMLPYVLQDVYRRIAMPFGTDWDDWAQQTAQIQYPAETIGQVRPGTVNTNWSDFYASDLKNIDAIIQKGKDAGYANVQAVGMIWRAFTFSQITDQWGDVPYSEAIQGASNITPKYDTQQQVYAGMFKTLKDAYAMLGATDAGDDFAGGDLIYGSTWDEWKKFDASLRMRLAMRLSQVDPTTAQQEFQTAYNDGGFTSNDDNAMIPWAGGSYGNPWWSNCLCGGGNRDDNSVSKTLVDTLLSLQDPRIKFYAEPVDPAATHDSIQIVYPGQTFDGQYYNGRTNGKIAEDHSLTWYSRIGNYWRANGQKTPSQILDYSEVLFLEAEAAQRGWISGDAGQLYTQAITAAFEMYEGKYATAPTAADLATYLANPRVTWAGGGVGGAGYTQIQLQKWISLYLVGMEAWSNWRRVRIPNLVPGPALAAGQGGITIIPVREPYPGDEQSLNNDNLMAAVAAQGGGLSLTTNMWWDTNSN